MFLPPIFIPRVNTGSFQKNHEGYIRSNNIKANVDMKCFTLGLIVTYLNLGELDGNHISGKRIIPMYEWYQMESFKAKYYCP